MEKTIELEEKIRSDVYNFFSEQCNVEVSQLKDDTDIIEELGGDSLMFLQLMESWKAEYKIDLEFRTIGRYMIKHPTVTLGSAINLALLIICEREKFEESYKN